MMLLHAAAAGGHHAGHAGTGQRERAGFGCGLIIKIRIPTQRTETGEGAPSIGGN